MRSYVPSSYRGHRARVAIAAAQDGQGETSKPLPLCGLPGVPTSAARSHRRPPTDKEQPLNSPNPPRSLVSRSLVALVSPTGRHSGSQTVPREGSTDEKRGGGRARAAPLFFSGAPRSLTPSSFGPHPPRSLVSRSLVALVSPTGRHGGFQTVPRKGSTDEGGGRTRAAPLFFFPAHPVR